MASGSFYWNTGVSFNLKVNYNTTPYPNDGYTKVEVSLNLENVSLSGSARTDSKIVIDGNTYSFAGTNYRYSNVTSNVMLAYYSVNVYHTSAKTITISGCFDWDGYIYISGGYSGNFNNVSGSSTITLSALNGGSKPNTAPSTLNVIGEYKNHGTTTLIFSGVAGATQYKIYHKRLNIDKTETQWYYTTTVSGSPVSISHGYCGLAIKFGISGINSAGEGPMKESEWIYHRGARLYNNSNFNNYCYIKRWDGTKWDYCYTRVYNGSEWINS